MDLIYFQNAKKITITQGVWGTISLMKGDCMPTAGYSSCSQCPVHDTINIYKYTLVDSATRTPRPGRFYESFNTPIIAQTVCDDNGFYQIALPPGHYSIGVLVKGELYFEYTDGYRGICPFQITSGIVHFDEIMTYDAVF